jgi:hypothetical protein
MRRIATPLLALIGSAAVAANAAAQPAGSSNTDTVEGAYTPLDLSKCSHKRGRQLEDYGSWRCAGYGGNLVFVSAGDQRTYISYGPKPADTVASGETLAAFNSAGKTIEWRIERKNGKPVPFATILRWNTTVPQDNGDLVRGQVLVVTRLGPGGVCHVGYVDGRANPNANELAVQLADTRARGFKCGKEKPVVVGEKGLGFSGPYNN